MVRSNKENNYEDLYKYPYPITKVWGDGTVAMWQGSTQECIDIIWIKPYQKSVLSALVTFNERGECTIRVTLSG